VKGCLSAAALFAGAVFFLFGALGAVTSMSLPWACLGGALMCLGWSELCLLAADDVPEPEVEAQDEPLEYCPGCGCNHLSRWMTLDDGGYHCRVCCEDGPVFVDRNVH
jgi:hypothetical protein